jgi:hypothetical protein
MSVLKSRRSKSRIQYLDTARELEIYTIKQCSRFPKRFMFLITKDIVSLATAIYNNVRAANSISVLTLNDANMRHEYITKANCHLQCLISQLDIAHEFISITEKRKPIKSNVWTRWAKLITDETKLLDILSENDKKEYNNLI